MTLSKRKSLANDSVYTQRGANMTGSVDWSLLHTERIPLQVLHLARGVKLGGNGLGASPFTTARTATSQILTSVSGGTVAMITYKDRCEVCPAGLIGLRPMMPARHRHSKRLPAFQASSR